MRKITYIFIQLIFVNFIAAAQVDTLINHYKELRNNQLKLAKDIKLTPRILESVNWYYPPYLACDGNISATFYKQQFLLRETHTGELLYGKYTLNDNSILCEPIEIYPQSKNILDDISLSKDPFTLEYHVDDEDFWYPIKLKNSNGITLFYAVGLSSEENHWYKILEDEVYKYDGEIAEIVGNLNVRSGASIKAKKISLLKDKTHIKIIGRSRNMEVIDGIKSYWYYVDYSYEREYCPDYGWVFGGYLKMK